MADRSELITFCGEYLAVDRFRDAAVNGLQVEGTSQINRLATAVSASRVTIEAALDWGAEALLVHHGLLWGNGLGAITGPTRERLKLLLAADLNLIAYHLPLDGHWEVGNNAQLATELGLTPESPFAEIAGQPIGVIATVAESMPLAELTKRLATVTERDPIVLEGGPEEVQRVAVLSGSGYSALDEAVAAGCDVLVTGDVREPTMALARELGITVLAGGHEATERLGVQALADVLAKKFNIVTRFFPDPNPI